jgi:hypothetical protein
MKTVLILFIRVIRFEFGMILAVHDESGIYKPICVYLRKSAAKKKGCGRRPFFRLSRIRSHFVPVGAIHESPSLAAGCEIINGAIRELPLQKDPERGQANFLFPSHPEMIESQKEIIQSRIETIKSHIEMDKSQLEMTESRLEIVQSQKEITKSHIEMIESHL